MLSLEKVTLVLKAEQLVLCLLPANGHMVAKSDITKSSKPLSPMQDPGQRLRRARERLRLKYRDVEVASQRIADKYSNDEFLVGLSRLADIENRGTIPSLYRLYSLSAIYGLDLTTVLLWYGVDLVQLPRDSADLPHSHTFAVGLTAKEDRALEVPIVPMEADFRKTSYVSREIRRWGKLPLSLLNSLDLQTNRYAFIGTDDWSMYPILAPGSFLQIDEHKKKIVNEGWVHELERPIYFLEHRSGFRCGWCTHNEGWLILQPHSSSHSLTEVFRFPGEVEVIGQVVGVAMRLGLGKRRHTRS